MSGNNQQGVRYQWSFKFQIVYYAVWGCHVVEEYLLRGAVLYPLNSLDFLPDISNLLTAGTRHETDCPCVSECRHSEFTVEVDQPIKHFVDYDTFHLLTFSWGGRCAVKHTQYMLLKIYFSDASGWRKVLLNPTTCQMTVFSVTPNCWDVLM